MMHVTHLALIRPIVKPLQPSRGQPFRLFLLEALLKVIRDPDAGMRTGGSNSPKVTLNAVSLDPLVLGSGTRVVGPAARPTSRHLRTKAALAQQALRSAMANVSQEATLAAHPAARHA